MKASVSSILDLNGMVDIVDIGANDIEGEQIYEKLVKANLANVFGFEPNQEALMRLNTNKGPNATYIGKAIYDGTQQELKLCRAEGMTSLLEPNSDILNYFHGYPSWAQVMERIWVPTVRLDDVEEISNIDYLKIDIQGAELEVFRNAPNLLSDCCVIHTEVEFLPLYENQPLFSEVEIFLREAGFIFHCFKGFQRNMIRPCADGTLKNPVHSQLNQATFSDAVFIKDFTKFHESNSEKLKKTALILNDLYGSYDLACRALMAIDEKTKTTNYQQKYLEYLKS